jgi:very-short-patch-repair endonuclease
LRAVLRGVHVTLSRLERGILELLNADRRVLPITNQVAGTRRVDCRWPELKLTIELDGFKYHNSRHTWDEDHRREREARARGDDFRRYTYRDVFEDSRAMMRELRVLVPRRAA